ncbi:MAG TPA: phosphatase PAP2 family protein [Candidatus Acidoferrum sp.]|jgi:membrane-associated phospholipid phosphatase
MNSRDNQEFQPTEAMAWPTVPVAEDATSTVTVDSRGPSVANSLRRAIAHTWAACGAFEWIALGYLAVSSVLVAFFAENVGHPGKLLVAQCVVAALILMVCAMEAVFAEHRPAVLQKFTHFWRHWYPHLFFLFCFEELRYLVHLVDPTWEDAKLIAFDRWLTGVHPAVWLEQFATPARNDFMQFAYLTYFLYLLVLGGVLYYRKEWRAYWSVMTYSAVAYAIGYLIAIFVPIESPWFSMAGMWHGPLQGGAATRLITVIEHFGRVRGAAFPSEHVAGSIAVLWGAWRHRRWLFWTMLPLVICMCVSTIWGRYHYVADIFGGIFTGTLGYWLGGRLMAMRGAVTQDRPADNLEKFSTPRTRCN